MSQSYDFVNFLGPVRNFNEKGNLKGRLQLKIKPLTPIFIGAGYEDRDGDLLYKCFERYGDKPVIPGSTLKGVLRTVSQAVSYSCADVSKDIKRDLPFAYNRDCRCIVCTTYGKMGLKGRASFGDFIMTDGSTEKIKIPIQMSPNINKREVYYKNGKLRGIKFYRHGDYRTVENAAIPVEAVMPGSVFEGEILFENIHKKQLELLCYSLGLDGSFQLKIGGNKSGFFGSCEIEVKNATINSEQFDALEYAERYGDGDKGIQANKEKLSEILNYKNALERR